MKRRENMRFALFVAIEAVALFVFIALTQGCKPVRETTVSENISNSTVQSNSVQTHTNIVRDTVRIRDSVIIRQRNDTVFCDRWHTVYKAQRVADTVFVAVSDSIVRCDTVRLQQKTVVQQRPTFRQRLGGFVGLLAIFFIILIIVRSVIKHLLK